MHQVRVQSLRWPPGPARPPPTAPVRLSPCQWGPHLHRCEWPPLTLLLHEGREPRVTSGTGPSLPEQDRPSEIRPSGQGSAQSRQAPSHGDGCLQVRSPSRSE